MVRKIYIPDRGDIIWLDLSPTKGHEQRGIRPVVVISPKSYNNLISLLLMCPITSNAKGYPFEEVVVFEKISGVVLVDQIRCVDWKERQIRFVGKLSHETVVRKLMRFRK